jgi:2-phospho-L-lactate/phosphoenolpyruvate guanylyltransferase
MSCWALVPVKARSAGKQRLAQALPEAARATLVRVMLEHVLDTLRGCPQIEEVVVMSPDRDRLPADIALLADAGADLNTSLTAALAVLEDRGATRIAIVSADLPQLTPEDVTALVLAGQQHGVALAPDHSGQGTNAACLALPARLAFHFGPGSFAQHVAEARRLGMEPARVERPGLAFDVDEPADVGALRARAGARYAFLD